MRIDDKITHSASASSTPNVHLMLLGPLPREKSHVDLFLPSVVILAPLGVIVE